MSLNRQTRFFCFLFIILTSVYAHAESSNVAKAAVEGSLLSPAAFLFPFGEKSCRLLPNGHGNCELNNGTPENFNVVIGKDDNIIKAYHFTYKKDLFLIYEFNDNESGAIKIVRLDGKYLILKWVTHIPWFNLGNGLVQNGSLYVTAIGTIGKIDLHSGKYIWLHKNLYRSPDYFNSFEQPIKKGNLIFFTESKPVFSGRKPLTLKVNDITGIIVE